MAAAKNKPNELYLTRVYDAPVKAVWEAWTDLAQVAQWWGPRGFTITTHSKDLRPGGHWAYTMHGPDGVDYPNKTVYFEVEPYKRLVYDHGGNDDRPPLFRVTVEFSDVKGKTKMDFTMALSSAEAAAETAKFIKMANGNSTWDRLAEYLAKDLRGKEQFVINRTFNVPLKTMFAMWTTPEHFSKWLPPIGMTMSVLQGDIKEGSTLVFSMTNGSDLTMYGRLNYVAINPYDGLAYLQQFCDKEGNVSRHPLAPTWPETMLNTVVFSAESDTSTRVTVTTECHGKVKADELAAFLAERSGMMGGWTGSFDKLDELLRTL